MTILHSYPATIIRVIDGDTVRMSVDVGFRMRFEDNFRLAGINAAEGKETDAAHRLRSLLEPGKEVIAYTTKPEKFGRWMADVEIPGKTISVCRLLLEEGHAVSYSGGKR